MFSHQTVLNVIGMKLKNSSMLLSVVHRTGGLLTGSFNTSIYTYLDKLHEDMEFPVVSMASVPCTQIHMVFKTVEEEAWHLHHEEN